jgi:Protein of unknown function (DUF664)
MEMKCAGLDAAQLARRSVPPSTMSLLRLVRHLTEEERHFRRVMAGEDAPMLYRTDKDRDGHWNGRDRRPSGRGGCLAAVADRGGAHRPVRGRRRRPRHRNTGVSDLGPDGADVQLRDVLVAQIAEYARHCGHADLLRERIDGRVGQ